MELQLTPEQESHLLRIAQHAGKSPEQVVMDSVSFLSQDEESFRLAVEQGLAEADAGNFIEEEEMDARFEKMMRR